MLHIHKISTDKYKNKVVFEKNVRVAMETTKQTINNLHSNTSVLN